MKIQAFFASNIQTIDHIIAGYYAWDAASDSVDQENDIEKLTEDDFDAHLDMLVDSGAKIDRPAAIAIALQFQAAAVADLHSGDA